MSFQAPTIPCIVCLRPLTSEPQNQCPHAATIFSSRGNYGSGVFDQLIGSATLEINVCDSCMEERRAAVL